jgi:sulfur relay (sulfurtransferase) DsrC/TusE family protein
MAERKEMKGNSEDLAKMFTKATAYTALRHFHLPKQKAIV